MIALCVRPLLHKHLLYSLIYLFSCFQTVWLPLIWVFLSWRGFKNKQQETKLIACSQVSSFWSLHWGTMVQNDIVLTERRCVLLMFCRKVREKLHLVCKEWISPSAVLHVPGNGYIFWGLDSYFLLFAFTVLRMKALASYFQFILHVINLFLLYHIGFHLWLFIAPQFFFVSS